MQPGTSSCKECIKVGCLNAEKICGTPQASYPAFGMDEALEASALRSLSEVHLRRLDSPDLLHRRAVTVISIEATPQEVLRNPVHLLTGCASPCSSQHNSLPSIK